MSLTVVVGGQFGGEGKGLATATLARHLSADILVKTGGPNCSHSYVAGGRRYQLRMVPSGANFGPSTIVYPAGSLIHIDTLMRELSEVGFTGELVIDHRAGIVTADHIEEQKRDDFYDTAGSTRTGTGRATALRAARRLPLADTQTTLQPYLRDVSSLLASQLNIGRHVLVEGSQGFGLSNYHGTYPYVTSRDSTAPEFLSQLGLGHHWITNVILVIKCMPTRNAGGDGPLADELDSKSVDDLGDAISEYGGGTYGERGQRRRVGLFDFELLRRAVIANTPAELFVTGFDRLSTAIKLDVIKDRYDSLEAFRTRVERMAAVPIGFEGWGEDVDLVRRTRPE
jgi:adenylosuccinate synthase